MTMSLIQGVLDGRESSIAEGDEPAIPSPDRVAEAINRAGRGSNGSPR